MGERKLNSIKNKNMSRVERQRLQSDIWGAYWSQCYIPLSFFLLFFTSPWKGKNWNRDSDVAESVLFPSEKGCITQEVQDRGFFMLFWSYLFQFHWPWQTARCLHTLMTLCVVLGSLVVAAQTQTLFVSIPDSKRIKEAAARLLFLPFMTHTRTNMPILPHFCNHRTHW